MQILILVCILMLVPLLARLRTRIHIRIRIDIQQHIHEHAHTYAHQCVSACMLMCAYVLINSFIYVRGTIAALPAPFWQDAVVYAEQAKDAAEEISLLACRSFELCALAAAARHAKIGPTFEG